MRIAFSAIMPYYIFIVIIEMLYKLNTCIITLTYLYIITVVKTLPHFWPDRICAAKNTACFSCAALFDCMQEAVTS